MREREKASIELLPVGCKLNAFKNNIQTSSTTTRTTSKEVEGKARETGTREESKSKRKTQQSNESERH